MTVINVGRMDEGNQRVTCCINYNMSLSTLDEFPPIEPRFFGRLGGSFNRLTIDNPGARLFITAELFSEFSMEG
jgi:hypothetical protein